MVFPLRVSPAGGSLRKISCPWPGTELFRPRGGQAPWKDRRNGAVSRFSGRCSPAARRSGGPVVRRPSFPQPRRRRASSGRTPMPPPGRAPQCGRGSGGPGAVCSRSSSETTASFIPEHSETSRRRTPQSRLRIGPASSSSHERKFQSSPAPYFTASASPCRKSSSFWDRRHSTSERTHSAGWKAPTRFFPSGRYAPVFRRWHCPPGRGGWWGTG